MSTPTPTVPIRDIVRPVVTWNPKSNNNGSTFRYIDIASIDRESRRITDAKELSCAVAPSRARQLVEADDIVVSTVRPNLNGVAHVPEDLHGATASTGFCVLRVDPQKACSRYLFHWVASPSFVADMSARATGQSYPAVSDAIIKDSTLPLPPLPEQKRIADILDKADAIRRKRAKALELTDQFLQSVFLDMFGDPVTNPKGWPLITGEDAFSMLQYGTSTKCHEVPGTGNLPVLRIPNVARGEVNFEDLKYATLSSGEVESLLLKQDDILLVRSNGNPDYIARCALWQGTGEFLFASYLIRGRLSESSGLRPLFLKELLSFPTYRGKLVRETQTTAGNYNISGSGLRRLVFIVPPPSLQGKFIEQVTQSKLIAQKMAAQKLVTEQQFNGLSTRAFRGEL